VVEQPQPCELLELVGREAVALHACKWGVRRASGAPARFSDSACWHTLAVDNIPAVEEALHTPQRTGTALIPITEPKFTKNSS
jgi:hypothetical protein